MYYKGIGPKRGIIVSENDAFEFALNAMRLESEETKHEFVEWFFSGDFVKEEETLAKNRFDCVNCGAGYMPSGQPPYRCKLETDHCPVQGIVIGKGRGSGVIKRAQIKDFIIQYIEEHGYSPTVREIASGIGVKSSGTIQFHLKRMLESGQLESDVGIGFPRAIRVPGYRYVKED